MSSRSILTEWSLVLARCVKRDMSGAWIFACLKLPRRPPQPPKKQLAQNTISPKPENSSELTFKEHTCKPFILFWGKDYWIRVLNSKFNFFVLCLLVIKHTGSRTDIIWRSKLLSRRRATNLNVSARIQIWIKRDHYHTRKFHEENKILGGPNITANLFCICLSEHETCAYANAVQICGNIGND